MSPMSKRRFAVIPSRSFVFSHIYIYRVYVRHVYHLGGATEIWTTLPFSASTCVTSRGRDVIEGVNNNKIDPIAEQLGQAAIIKPVGLSQWDLPPHVFPWLVRIIMGKCTSVSELSSPHQAPLLSTFFFFFLYIYIYTHRTMYYISQPYQYPTISYPGDSIFDFRFPVLSSWILKFSKNMHFSHWLLYTTKVKCFISSPCRPVENDY